MSVAREEISLNAEVKDDVGNCFDADIIMTLDELRAQLGKVGYCLRRKRQNDKE